MKQTTSAQPRKQRKWQAKAPLHSRQKMVSAGLSKDLKKKHGKNSITVRKGDKVKVLRGMHKGHSGEVMRVDLKSKKIFINGLIARKTDGKEVEKPIDPSNVTITTLYDEDQKRMAKVLDVKEEK